MTGLSDVIARSPGDLYSEDDYLILHSGRPVIYDDPSTFPLLAAAGRWDDSVFVQSLRDRRFSLILLWPGSGRLIGAERQAFLDSYELKYPDSIETYVPKAIPDAPQYALACRLTGGADAVTLSGASLSPGVAWRGVAPGDVLHVVPVWQATQPLGRSYASFVHLVDARGQTRAARDEPATGAGRPTTAWPPGQQIVDDLAVPIPADMPAGRYQVVIGLYFNDGGAIRPLLPACADPQQQYGDAVAAGWITVRRP